MLARPPLLPAFLAALVSLSAVTGCARGDWLSAPTLEPLEIEVGTEWIRDRRGRVVLLRGATYTLTETNTDPGTFDGPAEQTLAKMERLGMNLLRLPLAWSQIEPRAGVRTVQYLKMRVDPIVRLAAAHGQAVVLSMRQWPRGDCDGSDPAIPDWVCAALAETEDPSCGFWRGSGPKGVPLRSHYAQTWALVAAHYAQDARVVGFDVLDEPSGGTCFAPAPFEAGHLLPYLDLIGRRVRRSGASQSILVEPPPDTMRLRASEEPIAPSVVFAPHIWSQRRGPPPGEDLQDAYESAVDQARRMSAPLLIGAFGGDLLPFGGFRGTSPAFLLRSLVELDAHLVGGAVFALQPAQPGAADVIIPPTVGAVLARPFARRIAGIPVAMSFEPRSLEFQLQFEDDAENAPPDPTEIYLPEALYGSEPVVTITPPGRSRFDRHTQRLLVYRGTGTSHEVHVRPTVDSPNEEERP